MSEMDACVGDEPFRGGVLGDVSNMRLDDLNFRVRGAVDCFHGSSFLSNIVMFLL